MTGDERVGELLLANLRREVADRVAGGVEDAGARLDHVASVLDEDGAARAVLAAAAAERRRRDPYGLGAIDRSPRQDRLDRAGEVHDAAGDLVLARRLRPDGDGRVVLPGFGPATWRALAILRAGEVGARRAWARAVALAAGESLGETAPAFVRAGPLDVRLTEQAAHLHLLEAARQDMRDQLLRNGAAIGVALDRGNAAGVAMLQEECAAQERQIAEVDGLILRVWRAGGAAAVRYAAAA